MKKAVIVGGVVLAVIVVLFFVFDSDSDVDGVSDVVMIGGDSVTYFHPANSSESSQDCFDEAGSVCLTRGEGGPVYNSGSGDLKLGWGTCGEVTQWENFDRSGWKSIKENFEGSMSALVGHDFCFDADELGKWDVVFSEYRGGSTEGTFEYTRVRFG